MDPNDLSKDEFKELMERVREGSQDAANQLVDCFGPSIIRAVRRKLNDKIRTQHDSIDFSQAVWGSFFRKSKTLPPFEQPGQLIAYLGQISSNKVVDENRKRLRTTRFNVTNECPIPTNNLNEDHRNPGKNPTPSACASANEALDQITENEPPKVREVIQMKAEGRTNIEIAAKLNCDEKTIRRILRRLEPRARRDPNHRNPKRPDND